MTMAAFHPENLVALVDTREQAPYDLAPFTVERATLQTGDYTIRGLEDQVVIERKSLPDLLGCIGRGRDRFVRELERIRAVPCRVILVESDWETIEAGDYQADIAPAAACGTIASWIGRYAPFHFAGSRDAAERFAVRFLVNAARHELRRLDALRKAVA